MAIKKDTQAHKQQDAETRSGAPRGRLKWERALSACASGETQKNAFVLRTCPSFCAATPGPSPPQAPWGACCLCTAPRPASHARRSSRGRGCEVTFRDLRSPARTSGWSKFPAAHARCSAPLSPPVAGGSAADSGRRGGRAG